MTPQGALKLWTRWIRVEDQRTAGWLLLAYLLAVGGVVLSASWRGDVVAYGEGQSAAPQLVVDVNRATAAELALLPGIGPELADRIIRRRSVAPFRFVEELRQVQGIGPKTLDRLRGLVQCQEGRSDDV